MKYFILFSILTATLSYQLKAQDIIILKLKNETIEELDFPIKVGKVTASVPNSEIGMVNIPELNKDFQLQFEKDIATDIGNYIFYLQAGETFIDTVNLHITQFKIHEEINNNGDEVGILDLEIEFYKTTKTQRVSLYNFKEKIEISDPNVTIFHEYNVRKGITTSLKWMASQANINQFFVIEKKKKEQKPKLYIKANTENSIYQYNNQTTSNFRDVEVFMTHIGNEKLNNRIQGRSFVNGLAATVATVGLISSTIGIFKYDIAAKRNIDSGNAGNYVLAGLGGIFSGLVIQAIGKRTYRTSLIKKYNALQLEQPIVFTPYNPLRLGFAISIK